MVSAQALTQLRKDVSHLAVLYHKWRLAGFPADHAYHLQVEVFEADLRALAEDPDA